MTINSKRIEAYDDANLESARIIVEAAERGETVGPGLLAWARAAIARIEAERRPQKQNGGGPA